MTAERLDMTLTAKQEAFAQSIADGKTQADAYRTAYNAVKMKPETVWSKASELMADGKVAARVASLKVKLEEKALWTRERSVLVLAGIADSSESKPGEVVSAVKELNAMHGFNAPTRLDVTGVVIVASPLDERL